jgi:gluconokinase
LRSSFSKKSGSRCQVEDERYPNRVIVILMGVAGSGKTTVGRALADDLGWRFADADNYHTADSVTKMRQGIALTDADRAPWLAALRALVARALDRREHLVLACSALKQSYRDILQDGLRPVRFVYLKATEPALRARLADRPGHFAGPKLLASQLATLEEPDDALTLDARDAPERLVAVIRREFGL